MWLLTTKAGCVLTPVTIKETLCDPAEFTESLLHNGGNI